MPQLTLKEFGASVKAKYPQYAQYGDEEIATRMLSKYPQYQENIKPFESPRHGPTGATPMQVASDQAVEVLRGIPEAVTGIPSAIKAVIQSSPYLGGTAKPSIDLKGAAAQTVAPFTTATRGMYELGVGALPDAIQPNVRAASEMAFPSINNAPPPEAPEWKQAARSSGSMLAGAELPNVVSGAGALVNALKQTLPSTARAGSKFEQVMAKAKDVPLELNAADDIALRAQELAGRGGQPGRGSSMPKVMRDYLRTRETQPVMNYQTGRDFATSASRLSAAESQSANPVMQRQVAKLAKALNEADRAAAVKAGVGDVYDAAMREYRLAKGAMDMKEALVEVLKNRGVQAAVGTGAAYGAYRALAK